MEYRIALPAAPNLPALQRALGQQDPSAIADLSAGDPAAPVLRLGTSLDPREVHAALCHAGVVTDLRDIVATPPAR